MIMETKELNLNELEQAAGGMTEKERKDYLTIKDSDSLGTVVGKMLLKPAVTLIDGAADALKPITERIEGPCDKLQKEGQMVLKEAWHKICSWF